MRRFTPDAQGNVEREEYFGGDLQNLSTSTDLCGLSLPANQYEIAHAYQFGVLSKTTYVDENGELLPFHTLDLTIDPSTGLVAQSRDSAGIGTSYELDFMNRIRWIKPEDGAWTEYLYTRATSASSPAKVTIIQRPCPFGKRAQRQTSSSIAAIRRAVGTWRCSEARLGRVGRA